MSDTSDSRNLQTIRFGTWLFFGKAVNECRDTYSSFSLTSISASSGKSLLRTPQITERSIGKKRGTFESKSCWRHLWIQFPFREDAYSRHSSPWAQLWIRKDSSLLSCQLLVSDLNREDTVDTGLACRLHTVAVFQKRLASNGSFLKIKYSKNLSSSISSER
jgi:hypothetical protein